MSSRPDRALKLSRRSTTRETVVKCYLTSLIVDNVNKRAIREAIDARVRSYAPRLRAASLGLNYIVKQAFDGVDDVLDVSVPERLFETTFVRQLMLGTADAVKPEVPVKKMHQERPDLLRDDLPRYEGDRNIYSAGAQLYLTNVKNHLVTNLERFMIRVCKAHPLWTPHQAIAVASKIRGYPVHPEQEEFVRDENVLAFVSAHRRVLGFETDKDGLGVGWFDKKDNLFVMLRYFVYLARILEDFIASFPEGTGNEETEKQRACRIGKRFDILPICRPRSHFITIDTSVLYGLLKDLRLISCKNMSEFVSCQKENWTSVFGVNHLEGKSSQFTGTINTDGVSVCVHTTRDVQSRETDNLNEEEAIQYEDGDWVAAIDPGGTTIMHASVSLPSDPNVKPRQVKLSRKQYYAESGIINAGIRSRNWNKGIQGDLDALSTVSSKGPDFDQFIAYVNTWNDHGSAIWNEYTKPRWGVQRMRLYGGKKRSLAMFFNRLESVPREQDPSKRHVLKVAYGSAKFAPGGYGRVSAPTTTAFRSCQSRFPTRVIDEFRTTMVVLKQVFNEKTRETVRGLLWCESTTSKSKRFVNRDFNAAMNISRCFTGVRPKQLTRIRGGGCLSKTIGVRIADSMLPERKV